MAHDILNKTYDHHEMSSDKTNLGMQKCYVKKKRKKKQVTIKTRTEMLINKLIQMIRGENCLSVSFITERTDLQKSIITAFLRN